MSEAGTRVTLSAILVGLLTVGGLALSSGVASAVDGTRDKTVASALAAQIEELSARVLSLESRLSSLERAVERTKERAEARVDALRAELRQQRAELSRKIIAARNAKPPVVAAAPTFANKDCGRLGAFFGDKSWDKSWWDHDDWDGDRDGWDGDDHDGGWDGD